jgi:hypothetical protein
MGFGPKSVGPFKNVILFLESDLIIALGTIPVLPATLNEK